MDNANIHQQLGTLIAEVKNLRDDFRRSEDKSDRSRTKTHERIDDLVDRIAKIETAIVTQREDIDEMKPVTAQVRKWQLMGMGALAVVGIGGAAMGFTFASTVQRVLKLFVS
ncbi:DUF1515 family protein [Sinorhizobium americanum]|uniref:Uncharacterized protein DUF1515 n=1 Tax=Sinorhizobium americanum TaxID=194963 RepID=A0A4R2BU50_9HYPH|nr:DUF1515 family protein [Sinorhizobium americanum]TCN30363.1 uncharacterized protein DUF1515 [Sinorhizobium americanum]